MEKYTIEHTFPIAEVNMKRESDSIQIDLLGLARFTYSRRRRIGLATFFYFTKKEEYDQVNAFLQFMGAGVKVNPVSPFDDPSFIVVDFEEDGYYPLFVTSRKNAVKMRFFVVGTIPRWMSFFETDKTLSDRAAFKTRRELFSKTPTAVQLPEDTLRQFVVNRIIRNVPFRSHRNDVDAMLELMRIKGGELFSPGMRFEYVNTRNEPFVFAETVRRIGADPNLTIRQNGRSVDVVDSAGFSMSVWSDAALDIWIFATETWTPALRELVLRFVRHYYSGRLAKLDLPHYAGAPAFVHRDTALNLELVDGMLAGDIHVLVYYWMMQILLMARRENVGDVAKGTLLHFLSLLQKLDVPELENSERRPLFMSIINT